MILYNNVFAGGKTKDNIVKVTYSELAALGAAKNFDTSVVYQLTDYTISNTWAQNKGVVLGSLNHLYDILIAPVSKEILSINCAATIHDGETYFNEIELSQWKIKYICQYTLTLPYITVINDRNPKGSIVELTDESNNTCNFDFKNITFNGNLIFSYSQGDLQFDTSRLGTVYNNQYYISIENMTNQDYFNGLFFYNVKINSGFISLTNKECIFIAQEVDLINSEIRINSTQVESEILKLRANQAKNILINTDSKSIKNVEINNCQDCVINNGTNINNTTLQFLNGKTIYLEAHLNANLLISSTENKVNIIS